MEQTNHQEVLANEDKKKLFSGKRKAESHGKKMINMLGCHFLVLTYYCISLFSGREYWKIKDPNLSKASNPLLMTGIYRFLFRFFQVFSSTLYSNISKKKKISCSEVNLHTVLLWDNWNQLEINEKFAKCSWRNALKLTTLLKEQKPLCTTWNIVLHWFF